MLTMDWHEGTSMDTLGIDPFLFDEDTMDYNDFTIWSDIEKTNKKGNILIDDQDIEKVNKKGNLNL